MLIANKLIMSDYERIQYLQFDTELVAESLRLLERVAEGSDGPHLHALLSACQELNRRANISIRARCSGVEDRKTSYLLDLSKDGDSSEQIVKNLHDAFMKARLKPLTPLSIMNI